MSADLRYRQPFSLFARTHPSGIKVYYYQVSKPDGKRTTAKSTGQVSKTAARLYCMGLWRDGKLLPTSVPKKIPTLSEFADGFWVPGSEYMKYRERRESPVSKGHAANQHRYYRGYILPTFGKLPLDQITSAQVETWFFGLRDKGLANQSCNHLLSNLRTILAEGVRKGHIPTNPADAIKPLSKDAKTRGVLTTEEVRELLGKEGRAKYWASTQLYVLNLMAATTGLRMGELQALTWDNLLADRIIVRHSWDRRFGLKSTKSGKERIVPLPSVVAELLQELAEGKTSTGFIFLNTAASAPIHETFLVEGFYDALRRFGLSEADRVARNITFHGWRHFFNTLLRRAGIQDSKVQMVIGHASTAMSDHYTHFDITDLQEVREAQYRIIGDC